MSSSTQEPDLCKLPINTDVEIITLVVTISGLVIISFITCDSIQKLPNSKEDGPNVIKKIYYIILVSTYLSFIFTLIPSILCILPQSYDQFIVILNTLLTVSANVSFLCLLAILILRLIHNEHIHLSQCEDWSFIILYGVTLTFTVLSMIEYLYVGIRHRGNWNAAGHALGIALGINGPIALCLYILTASYCIASFVCKVIRMSNNKQMIENAVKYVSILSIAIIWDTLTAVIWILTNVFWETEIDYNYSEGNNVMVQILTLLTICCCFINALCLYLHFSFSDAYYQKYCKICLECCWKKTLKSAAERRMKSKNGFESITSEEVELKCTTKEARRNIVMTKT